MADYESKTLYIGNLDPSVTEDILFALFNQIGPVVSCKILRDVVNDPYAFVEFENHQVASTALASMNKRIFFDKEIRVNWASSPAKQTSSHYHIFVGDLCPDLEANTLREAFEQFGEVSYCRIVRDPTTMVSKGYAFLSFVTREAAANAIESMNGKVLGSRPIRTNWSTRKSAYRNGSSGNSRPSFDEIYKQASATNSTVYCGGFQPNTITEDMLHKHFIQYGPIIRVRAFKEKGFSFVKFIFKESAARAIEMTHNGEVNGQPVKCYWGKEGTHSSLGDGAASQNTLSHGYGALQSPPQDPGLGYYNHYSRNGLTAPMLSQSQLNAQAGLADDQNSSMRALSDSGSSVNQMSYGSSNYQTIGPMVSQASYPFALLPGQYLAPNYSPFPNNGNSPPLNQQALAGGYRMVPQNSCWTWSGGMYRPMNGHGQCPYANSNGSGIGMDQLYDIQ